MEYLEIHLHPALVHFPVALFVSALLMEAASFLFKKESFHRSAVHLYALACILVPFAVWTGLEEAEHEHLKHPVADLHRNFALATLWVSWAGAVLLGLVHKRFQKYSRLVFIVFLFLTAALVTLAAYNGGRLVYEYGIGVEL